MKYIFIICLLFALTAMADSPKTLQESIVNQCAGSKTPQACQKTVFACLKKLKAKQKAELAECALEKNGVSNLACLSKEESLYRKTESDLLLECM